MAALNGGSTVAVTTAAGGGDGPRYLVFSSSSSGGVSSTTALDDAMAMNNPEAPLAPCTVSFLTPQTSKPSAGQSHLRNIAIQRTVDYNPDGNAAVLYHWASVDAIKPLTIDSPSHMLHSDVFLLGGLALRLSLSRRTLKNAPSDDGSAPATGLTVTLSAESALEEVRHHGHHVDPLSDLWERRVAFEVDVFSPQSAVEVAPSLRQPNAGYGESAGFVRRGLGTGRVLREATMSPSHRVSLIDPLIPLKDLASYVWPPQTWRDFLVGVIAAPPTASPVQGCAPVAGVDDASYFASEATDGLFRGSHIVLRLSINVRRDPKSLRLTHHALSHLPRPRVGHVGMQNPASVCFVNALCQMIFHNTVCRRAIHELPLLTAASSPATLQLQRIIYQLERSRTPVSPTGLFEALQLSQDAQQDAHEFLLKFFFNFALRQVKERLVIGTRYVVRCVNVKFDAKSPREDHFDLAVAPLSMGLVAAINKEFAVEPLQDLYDTQHPEYKLQPATRQLALETLPELLFIHVRRFDKQLAKIHGSMPVPLSFALSHCAAGKDAAELQQTLGLEANLIATYVLQSAVLHHGPGISSGHYTTMCRSTNANGTAADATYGLDAQGMPIRFLHFDDEAVYPVPVTEGLRRMSGMHWLNPSSSAYILLFVRSDVVARATHEAVVAPASLRDTLVREGLVKPSRNPAEMTLDDSNATAGDLEASTSAEIKAVASAEAAAAGNTNGSGNGGIRIVRRKVSAGGVAALLATTSAVPAATTTNGAGASEQQPQNTATQLSTPPAPNSETPVDDTEGATPFNFGIAHLSPSHATAAMEPLTLPVVRNSSSETGSNAINSGAPQTPANRLLSGIDLVTSDGDNESTNSHHGSFASPPALVMLPDAASRTASPRPAGARPGGPGSPQRTANSSPRRSPQPLATGQSSPRRTPRQDALESPITAVMPALAGTLNRTVVGPVWGTPAFVRCTFFTLTDISRLERLLPGAQADLVACGAPSVFNAQSANSRQNMVGFTAAVRGDVTISRLKRQALLSVPSVQRDCRTTPLGEAATINPADIPVHLSHMRLWLFVPRANGTFRPSLELSDLCYALPARPGESDAALFAMEAELLKQVPPTNSDRATRPRLVADAVFALAACNALPTDDFIPAISIYVEVLGLQQLPRLLLPRSLQYLTPTASPVVSREPSPHRNPDDASVLLFVRICLITTRKLPAAAAAAGQGGGGQYTPPYKGSPATNGASMEFPSSAAAAATPECIQPSFVGTVYVSARETLLQVKLGIMQKQRGVCGDNPNEFIMTEVVRPHRVDVLDENATVAESNLGHGDLIMLVSRHVRTPVTAAPAPERPLDAAKALVLASEAVRRGSNIQYAVVRIIDDSGLSSRIRIRTNGNYHPFAMRRRPLGRDPQTGQLRDSAPFIIGLDLERDTLASVAEKVRSELEKRVKSLVGQHAEPQGTDDASLRAAAKLANVSNLFSVRLWAAARVLAKQHGAVEAEYASLPAIPLTDAMMEKKLAQTLSWFKDKTDADVHNTIEQLRQTASDVTPATFFWPGSPVAALLQWDHPTLYSEEVDGVADIAEMQRVGGDVPTDSFHGKDMEQILAHADETAYRKQRGKRRTSEAERHFNAHTAIPFPDLPVSYVLPIFAEVTSREALLSPLPDFPVAVSWLGDEPGEPLQVLRFPKFPGSGTVSLLMHLCALQLGLISASLKPSDACPCSTWALTVARGSTIDHIVQSCCLLTPFSRDGVAPNDAGDNAPSIAHPGGSPTSAGADAHASMDRIRSGPSALLSKLLFFDSGATNRAGEDAVVQLQECREGVVMISVSFVETATGLYRGTPFLIELPRSIAELRRSVFAVVAAEHGPLTLAAELARPNQPDAPPSVTRLSSDKDFTDMLAKLQRRSRTVNTSAAANGAAAAANAQQQRTATPHAHHATRAVDIPHSGGSGHAGAGAAGAAGGAGGTVGVVWLAPEWELSRYLVFY